MQSSQALATSQSTLPAAEEVILSTCRSQPRLSPEHLPRSRKPGERPPGALEPGPPFYHDSEACLTASAASCSPHSRVGWLGSAGGLWLCSGVTRGTLIWKLRWAGIPTLSTTRTVSDVCKLSSGSSGGPSTESLSFPLYSPSAGLELLAGVALGSEQKLQTWETPAPEAPSHPFHPSQSGQPKSKGRGKGPLEEGGAAENSRPSLIHRRRPLLGDGG